MLSGDYNATRRHLTTVILIQIISFVNIFKLLLNVGCYENTIL